VRTFDRISCDAPDGNLTTAYLFRKYIPTWRLVVASKRTTHRSKSGKKLYAVRSKTGKFKDIQSYKRAQGQDVKRRAKSERRKSD
jgi:hypothetical protein